MSAQTAIGLIGAGGFGREVMPLLKQLDALRLSKNLEKPSLFFVEKNPTLAEINGIKCISETSFFALKDHEQFFNIAIGSSTLRETIANRCIAAGAKPLEIRSPDVLQYDEVEIGEGAILCAGTILTSNIKIGKFFHSNLNSYVAHDCVIGDYVTFAPRVHCNGNVHIGNHAYIGTGAIIKQGSPDKPLRIGEGAVIGMGAIVTKDVAPFTTVVGNPARPLVRS